MLETLTPFTLYMIMQADQIVGILGGAAFLGVVALVFGVPASVVLWAVGSSVGEEDSETQKREAKACATASKAIIFVLCFFVFVIFPASTFYPNTKTLLVAYGVPAAIQTINEADQIKAIGGKSLSAINKVLDGYLQEEK